MSQLQPNADHQNFLKQGKFMIQRSSGSGEYYFYPRVIEPGTGNADLEWVEAQGGGTVYSTTIVRPRPPEEAYNVCLVELDEGPRLMSRIEGLQPEQVTIGLRVKARIVGDEQWKYVVFDPADTP